MILGDDMMRKLLGIRLELKGKGVDKKARKSLNFDEYMSILQREKAEHKVTAMRFQSDRFTIKTRHVEKRALSCYDDKRYYMNTIESQMVSSQVRL